jgi:hypothetical protein
MSDARWEARHARLRAEWGPDVADRVVAAVKASGRAPERYDAYTYACLLVRQGWSAEYAVEEGDRRMEKWRDTP